MIIAAHNILEDLGLVLCVAAVTTVVCQKIRQPVVVGYLLAGIIVGPYTPLLFASPDRIHTLSELGVILLMFALGLEFRVRKLVQLGPTSGFVTALQVGLMIWLGYMVGSAMGWTRLESIFTGAALSISSTTIVAKAFGEEQIPERVRELVFGVLLAEDLTAVLLLAVLTALASGVGLSAAMMVKVVGRLAIFLALLVGGGMLIVPWTIRQIVRMGRAETTLVASIGICFGFSIIAEHAGYSVALGAFLAGSLVAESGDAQSIEHLVAPVRDMFAAVFFVSVGMMIDPRQIAEHWAALTLLVVAVIAGKLFSVTLASLLSGAGVRTSVQAGMSLTQIGEFSFIIAGLGIQTHSTRDFVYTLAVAVSAVTTFTTPFMIRASGALGDYVARKIIPQRLGSLQVIYDALMERTRQRRSPGGALGWAVALLGCGALGIIAILVFNEVDPLGLTTRAAQFIHLSYFNAGLSVDGVALILCAPFIYAMHVGARRLARAIAMRALVAGAQAAPCAAGDALIAVLHATILLVTVMPLLAIAQPFLEPLEGLGVVVIGTVLMTFVIWSSARKLQGNLHAVADLIAQAFAASRTTAHEVAGFGTITPIALGAGAAAIGRTLAQLDLRAATGATAVAIARGDGQVIVPSGEEVLGPGDVLEVVGPREHVEAARRLLIGAPPQAAA
ncbi:MAG TPA: cation:proton antiporter [Candidatus Binataceae bacterium]|nr:cation:proton antiporter [Candidatus Binataceae bacterium]